MGGLEDSINLDGSSNSCSKSEKDELQCSITEPSAADSHHTSTQLKEDAVNEKNLSLAEGDNGDRDDQHAQEIEIDKDVVQRPPVLQEDITFVETVSSVQKIDVVNSGAISENGCRTVQNDNNVRNYKVDDTQMNDDGDLDLIDIMWFSVYRRLFWTMFLSSSKELWHPIFCLFLFPIISIPAMSGVKRARITYVDQEPSVHVVYNFLTRASKRKLEELLQQWSQWHAQQKFPSNDSNETLESGEETFFPALHVGLQKASTVSFWVDNQTRKEQNKFIPLDDDSVPLYDRGYVLGLTSADDSTKLEGGVGTLESSRCFNCGSYSHSLKDCPKPRDNVAVNNARQQHNSKRGLTSGPRNSTRYYQNSHGGKYDGLRPGFLGSETRQLLGLGELDPPPWLRRMREIGYPPGYLDPDDEDQPSGITIYAGEKTEEDCEDGEIHETVNPEPQKKMSVEFPGINAPIPESADERRWASLPEASSFDSSRNRFSSTSDHSSKDSMRGRYSDSRRFRDYRDDGPPGCNNRTDLSTSSYIPRYSNDDGGSINEIQGPRGNPLPKSPNLGRSLSDRGRWSPLVHGGSPSRSPYSSLAYSSPNSRESPHSYSPVSFDNSAHGNHHHRSSSDRRKGKHDYHHHHRK